MSRVTTPPTLRSLALLEAATGKRFAVERPGATVYLLLDTSGSMAEDCKFTQAKRGATGFAEKALTKGYAVGLIQFASAASRALRPQRTRDGFDTVVNALKPRGGTDMAAAIGLAVSELNEIRGIKVICLVTDGMPDDKERTRAAAKDAACRGVEIMAIGTDDADRVFLATITTRDDLAVTVETDTFGQAITDMALLLPAPRRSPGIPRQ